MKKTMYISKHNGSYYIHATNEDGLEYPYNQYLWYTEKESIRQFREKHNLKHKHFKIKKIKFCSANYGFMY